MLQLGYTWHIADGTVMDHTIPMTEKAQTTTQFVIVDFRDAVLTTLFVSFST